MTRDELSAQRAEVVQAEQDHLLRAAEARGALRLLDLWMARIDLEAATARPEKDREDVGAHPQ